MLNKIFTPLKIGSVELKNRFIVSPMVMNFCTEDGFATDRFISYHEEKAKGGWGLIITEDYAVSPRGKGYPNLPGLWKDEQIPSHRELTERVHKHGAKIFAQIYHCGRQTQEWIIGCKPEAPSAIPCPVKKEVPRELTTEEVKEIVTMFGDTALRAKKAGFDGVMVHAAHGYLINEFLSNYSNKRNDEYGGCFANRVRFLLEIIADIRKKCGRDFAVDVKISGAERVPEGMTVEDMTAVAILLEQAGVDSINVSSGVYATWFTQVQPAVFGHGWLTNDAAAIKRVVSIPVTVIGRVNDPMYAEAILQSGKVDAVYMGRASLADPHMPNKAKEGCFQDIVRCTACLQGCTNNIDNGRPAECVVNPCMGHEFEYNLAPVKEAKTVYVAGGGPAGCEAAIMAAKKGHKVTLFEKSGRLGGNFRLAAVAPYKGELASFLSWQNHTLKELGVDVKLNTELTADIANADNPDVILVATGGKQAVPPIPGVDNPIVKNAVDLLAGKFTVSGSVAVIGGGLVGGETANFLASHENKVSIFEMQDDIITEEPPSIRRFVLRDYREHDVQVYTSTKILAINEDGSITYENSETGVATTKPFDLILLAAGTRPENTLSDALQGGKAKVINIGDANVPGDGYAAIHQGYKTALAL